MSAKLYLRWSVLLLSGLLWTAFYDAAAPAVDEPEITVPPGFVVEHLYSPMTADSSSWVALTTDDRGRLLASDQHGALYRIRPPALGADSASTQVEQLDVEIGHANGLLWAFGSLYVTVNSEEGVAGRGSGLYRVLDTDGDDRFDTVRTLRTFEGFGEHGPHAVILGPDSLLYLVAGNHTDLPEPSAALVPPGWREDGLFPSIRDPRGHAVDREAPGGWIARTDSLGQRWELFSVGFRNAYDVAFNPQGDLFTFDSDMEWDLGMPWYRPIRVCHVTSGSEFGWRTGSGKWPAYYPDNLPPVVELGQGSPTGVLMGTGAAFPARYQQGLFVFDWSFGTIYLVELQPQGGSYAGRVEEFLTGVPLPLTDGVIGTDGALYFTTGGRKLDSHLYRVYYRGDETTRPPTTSAPESQERVLRRHLEAFHGRQDTAAVEAAWPHLNHPDRFVRYAARVALEHQPVEAWAHRVEAEPDPLRRLYAVVALARQADAALQEEALQALAGINLTALDEAQQLDLLRAYGLVFARMGMPPEPWRTRVAAALGASFPASSDALNRELAYLLAYLEAPGSLEETLALLEAHAEERTDQTSLISETTTARSDEYGPAIAEMRENPPAPQEIAYAFALSHVREGWTLEQRQRYFRWFYDALRRSGGESYKGFIEIIRTRALDQVPPEEQEALADLTGAFSSEQALNLADLPQPKGPGRSWNLHEVGELMETELEEKPRNFEQGRQMYAAALCKACHVMRGDGGNIGPDLTQVGTRFSRGDLMEAILSPSRAVSDQYAATLFTRTDGSTIVGRVVDENERAVTLNQNPFDPGQVITIPLRDIQAREPSPVSIMPPRLIDRLNEEELMDLVAYLLAGGDPAHDLFQPDTSGAAK